MLRCVLSVLITWPLVVNASIPSLDPETGLATWQTETAGIQVRLTQISPDQVRAFYLARGFSAAAVARYAAECVFMTVIRNTGTTPVEHRLADWRYDYAGKTRSIRSKAAWDDVWQQLGEPESARIAFAWAQIPATQTFAPGDWNQGMTAYRVPRGQRFNLRFSWRVNAIPFSGSLEEVQCADDPM